MLDVVLVPSHVYFRWVKTRNMECGSREILGYLLSEGLFPPYREVRPPVDFDGIAVEGTLNPCFDLSDMD
jgi:hypothetical protein